MASEMERRLAKLEASKLPDQGGDEAAFAEALATWAPLGLTADTLRPWQNPYEPDATWDAKAFDWMCYQLSGRHHCDNPAALDWESE